MSEFHYICKPKKRESIVMNKYVRVLTVIYDLKIENWEIPLFRGAVINAMGDSANLLFHNHIGDDEFRYRYPLIQYKRLGGKAAIVCIGEGTQAIGEFFASGNFDVMIGNRHEKLQLLRAEPRNCNVQVWEQMFRYRLRRWLPLNSENYKKYMECESLAERCLLLEGILRGNILSMGKGLDVDFDKQVKCSITELQDPYQVEVKGVKMMCFSVDFSCNVSLPANVGLGKHASLNCGIVSLRHKDEVIEN